MTPEELDEAFRKKMDALDVKNFEFLTYNRLHFEEVAPRILTVTATLWIPTILVCTFAISKDAGFSAFVLGMVVNILVAVCCIPFANFRPPTGDFSRRDSLSQHIKDGYAFWRIRNGLYAEVKRRKKSIKAAEKALRHKQKQYTDAENLVAPKGFITSLSSYFQGVVKRYRSKQTRQIEAKLDSAHIQLDKIKQELAESGVKDL